MTPYKICQILELTLQFCYFASTVRVDFIILNEDGLINTSSMNCHIMTNSPTCYIASGKLLWITYHAGVELSGERAHQ